jgi:hypothetical protein
VFETTCTGNSSGIHMGEERDDGASEVPADS